MKKLYVGNLPYSFTEIELEELFAKQGSVQSANLALDRDTGRSRGFGFVEMDDTDAETAISELNGYEVEGRALVVNEARPKRPGFGGGGGGGGGGRGGRRPRQGNRF